MWYNETNVCIEFMLLFDFLVLGILFLALGKSADFVVRGVRNVSENIGIPTVLIGLILGFFTSIPEFFVGINAALRGVNEVAFGNSVGGIIVLFGLICGIYLLSNKDIELQHNFSTTELFFIVFFLLFPFIALFFGMEEVTQMEGFIIIGGYLAISFFIFSREAHKMRLHFRFLPEHKKLFMSILLGVLGVVVFSRFIVDMALELAHRYQMPLFLMSVIVFAIGTNLPELIITIRSLQRKVSGLPLGNIIGSDLSNTLIIGIIAFFQPIQVVFGPAFFLLFVFFVMICIAFLFLAITGRRFQQQEGFVLLAVYVMFIVTQIFFKNI